MPDGYSLDNQHDPETKTDEERSIEDSRLDQESSTMEAGVGGEGDDEEENQSSPPPPRSS